METETSMKQEAANDGNTLLSAVPSGHKVALCWATKKRHIAVDGKVLCEPKHTTVGYSVKNGGYNSLSLSGIPTHFKISDDSKNSHGDGIVPYVPLEKQPFKIDRRSICKKCQKKYDALWHSR